MSEAKVQGHGINTNLNGNKILSCLSGFHTCVIEHDCNLMGKRNKQVQALKKRIADAVKVCSLYF